MKSLLRNVVAPRVPLEWQTLFLGPKKSPSGGWQGVLLLTPLLLYGWFQSERMPRESLGPKPHFFSTRRGGFSFTGVAAKNPSVDLDHFSKLGHSEAHNVILNSLPPSMRPRLVPHLDTVLHFAEKFRVDPFWVISIMWTESHFNIGAVSRVNARGLMQVMPGTAVHIGEMLKKKMERKVLLAYAETPYGNVEFGVFYLSFLLKKFRGNHTLATVAYNMGPYWVSKRLRHNLPVGTKNIYLEKVNRAYRRISRGHRDLSLPGRTPAYFAYHGYDEREKILL